MLNPRDPQGLSREPYDLIVVGGGIYGIMVALEAARRRLRALLLERGDFGGATSHNSLRIVHGGLRYLQTLDLHRFRESVAERHWFLRHFPDLVRPLPCLMPLYGQGLRRPAVFRLALALNDALSQGRNRGVARDLRLPGGRILDPAETLSLCPASEPHGLRGGALWYDALAPDAPRLMIEALHWACAHGARALNYVQGTGILQQDGQVAGLSALDRESGETLAFRAPLVVNAAGPWAPAFAAACAAEAAGLFQPALAWNVLFRCPPPSRHAIAASPPGAGAQTYFLVPWKGALLAGTGYAPWSGGPDEPRLPEDRLAAFIEELNRALPGLGLERDHVARVMTGLLPASAPGTTRLSGRETILDHGAAGGPAGLFSLSGVKLTTARRVADKALGLACPTARPVPYAELPRPAGRGGEPERTFDWMPRPEDSAWKAPLRRAAAEEAVLHLDDLLLRRSSLGDNPARALALAPGLGKEFGWDEQSVARDMERLRQALGAPAGDAGREGA